MVFTPVEKIKDKIWDQIMAVNVKGVFLASKYTVPIMKRLGGGVIINIACIAGVQPQPGLSAYSTSKAAVIMLTKSMAIEFAPFNIPVNVISPGTADTPMLAQFMSEQKLSHRKYHNGVPTFVNSVPLGCLVEPDDMAHTVLFLLSEEGSLITGACFDVDAGRRI
jgi:3-oxoacyl-[acyl-carrier protein] reductase